MTGRRLAYALAVVLAACVIAWIAMRPRASAPKSETATVTEPAADKATVIVHVSARGSDLASAKAGIVEGEDLLRGEVTGADGRARLTSIPVGKRRLVVTHPHYRRAEREIDVVAAETLVEIELLAGAEIEVSVVDDSGRPVVAARLGLRQNEKELRTGATDAKGTFVFGGLDPGSYLVHASAEKLRSKDGAALSLARDERVQQRIRLDKGRTLAGRVVDEAGLGVPEASVGSSDESGAITTTSDDGRFELSGLGEGPVNLFATKIGYAPRQVRGLKTAGRNVELVLERPASVEGEIVLQGKSKSLMVSACQLDAHFGKEICVERVKLEPVNGSFSLQNLPAGNYHLVIEADGHATERVRFTVNAGKSVSVGSVTLRSQ
jgi:hypothetical protein